MAGFRSVFCFWCGSGGSFNTDHIQETDVTIFKSESIDVEIVPVAQFVSWTVRSFSLATQLKAHVGDKRTLIVKRITNGNSVVDISDATVKELHLYAPDGTIKVLTCNFFTNGSDGKIIAITDETTWNTHGRWYEQVRITMADGGDWAGAKQTRRVLQRIF